MVVELVGAADHVFAAFEGLVDDHGEAVFKRFGIVGEAHGTEKAGGGVKELLEFLGLHGAEFGCADGAEELGLVDLVIAAEKGGNAVPCVRRSGRAALEGHVGHALDVGGGGDFEESSHIGDGGAAGRGDKLGQAIAGRFHLSDWIEEGRCLFEVGRVAADGTTGDEVFAGAGVDHELLGLGAAHGAGVGFDGDEAEAAAGEDSAIDGVVEVEGLVEACLVDIKGIAVLHGELAHTKEAGLGPRFVAELGLDLVPDLRQLLVAAQFAAGDGGHDLFVGHAQAQIGALAVFEAEHVVAHAGPAAALLPGLARQDAGQEELLGDLVHLFADNADDLVKGALGEEEIVVDARAELADVAGAEQELVTGHFGVRRGLTQSGNEELGPTMHRKDAQSFPSGSSGRGTNGSNSYSKCSREGSPTGASRRDSGDSRYSFANRKQNVIGDLTDLSRPACLPIDASQMGA